MDTFLPQRYQLQKYIGQFNNQHWFTAKDALHGGDVIWNLVIFEKLETSHFWQSLVTYYRSLVTWSQEVEKKFLIPYSDFGEIDLSTNLPICQQIQSFCPEILINKNLAVYFVTPQKNWKFLNEYRESPHSLTPQFVELLAALQELHDQEIILGNFSYNNIMFCNVPEGLCLAWHQVGIDITLDHQETRDDLYYLALVWFQTYTGEKTDVLNKYISQAKELHPINNTQSHLPSFNILEPLLSALRKCLAENPSERLSDAQEFWEMIESAYPQLHPNIPRRRFLLNAHWNLSDIEKNITDFFSQKNNEVFAQIWKCGSEIGPHIIRCAKALCKNLSLKKHQIIHWNCVPNRAFPLIEISDNLQSFVEENNINKVDTISSFLSFSYNNFNTNYYHIRQGIIQNLLNQPTILFISNLDLASPELWDYIKYLILNISTTKNSSYQFYIMITCTIEYSEAFDNFLLRLSEDNLTKNVVRIVEKRNFSYSDTQYFIAQSLGLSQAPEKFSQYISQITENNPLYVELVLKILIQKNFLYREQQTWCLAKAIEDLEVPKTLKEAIKEWLSLFSKDTLKILDWLIVAGWNLPWDLVCLGCSPLDREFLIFIELIRNNFLQKNGLLLATESLSINQYFQESRSHLKSSINRMIETIRQYQILPYRDILLADLLLLNHQNKSILIYCSKILSIFLKMGLESAANFWWEHWQKTEEMEQIIPESLREMITWGWNLQKYAFVHQSIEKINNWTKDGYLLTCMLQISRQERNYEVCNQYLKVLKQNLSEPSEFWQAIYYGLKAKVQFSQKLIEESSQSLSKGLAILQTWFAESEQKEICLNLYQYLLSDSIIECLVSRETYLQDGLNMACSLKNILLQLQFYFSLAWNQKYEGQYALALATLQKGLDLSQQHRFPQWQIRFLLEMIEVYCFLSAWKKATNLLNQLSILAKKEGLKNFRPWISLNKARIVFLQKQENFIATSEDLYRDAWDACKRYKTERSCQIIIMSELIRLLAYKNEQAALQVWGQARQEFEVESTPLRKIQINIAKLELDCGSEQPPALILEIGQETLNLIEKFHYSLYHYQVLFYIGSAYRANGNIAKSIEYFRLSLQLLETQISKLSPEIQETFVKNSILVEVKDIISHLTKDLSSDLNQLQSDKKDQTNAEMNSIYDIQEQIDSNKEQSSLDKKAQNEKSASNLKGITAKKKLSDITKPKSDKELESVLSDYRIVIEKQNFQEQRRQIERLKKLVEINQKLNSEHNVRKLLDIIMDTAIELTQAERGFIILAPQDKNKIEIEEKGVEIARNFEKEDIKNPHFEVSHSITENIIRTGIPILTKDATQDERFDGYRSVTELKLHSILAVPLRIKEKIIGALYLDNRFEKAVFSEDDKELLESFADQAAIAIENARLLTENLQKQEELKKNKDQIERLNQKLSAANMKLTQKIERREEELQEAKIILQRNQNELVEKFQYHNLIGRSSAMQEIFKILEKITDKNIPVQIYGESGTGKELVARAIHFSGCRKDKNFLSENCAALSDTLLASELFGHVKGSFTGAYTDKKGLFELADGGTLFLDEVGDMSPSMQANLLRVLENGVIRRVGGKDEIPIDVRIISASNKQLNDLVSKGIFREDLLFRLKVVEIIIPPLRERKEDIPILVEHFLHEFSQETKTQIRSIDKNALAILMHYTWPGNVRELRNTLYKVLSLNDDQELIAAHFKNLVNTANAKAIDFFSQELSVDDYARLFVENKQSQYNDSQLAKILGFSRKTLWEKRKKWNLFRP